jgi:predicted phage tail protein
VAGNRVTLGWLPAAGGDAAASYVVEAGSQPSLADLASFDTGSSNPGLIVDTVPAGRYFVRVRAKNVAGVSAPSNEVVVTVGGSVPSPCDAALNPPAGLAATVTGTSVTLSWAAAAGCPATEYVIEAGSGPGLANLATVDTGSTATSFIATQVGAGTYFVRVRAANAAGHSAPSNEVIFAIGCAGPPGAPAGLGYSTVFRATLELFWSSGAGLATSHLVEVGSFPGGANLATVETGNGGTSYAFSNVPAGDYFVRVRAKNACGTSGASNEVVPRVR